MRTGVLGVFLLLASGSFAAAQAPAGAGWCRRVHARLRQLPQARPVRGAATRGPARTDARVDRQLADQRQDGRAGQRAHRGRASRAVAQFLTGRTAAASTTSAPAAPNVNRCTAATPTTDPARAPSWMGWGNDAANSRFAPQAGLAAADLPKLTLKWAFALSGRHLVARAAGAGGWEAVRRQRQRRAPRAGSEDGLHLLDLQGGVWCSKRVDGWTVQDRRARGPCRVLRRSACERVRRGRRHRPADLEAQGGRASGRRDHGRDRDSRRQGVRRRCRD